MWAKVDVYRRDESILTRDIAPTSKYLLENRLAYKFVRYRSAHDIGVRIFNARMQQSSREDITYDFSQFGYRCH